MSRIDWRRVAHNVVAHPLLVLWPTVGERLHDATVPTERCEVCGAREVDRWDVEGVPFCVPCWDAWTADLRESGATSDA